MVRIITVLSLAIALLIVPAGATFLWPHVVDAP